jgi:curved DNA-binding protein CbpA
MTYNSSSSSSTRRRTNESYYDILGLPAYTSDAKIIRQGYLKQAVKYHPDKNPDQPEEAKDRFVQIGHAYEVLSNSYKKSQYDRDLKCGKATSTNNYNDYSDNSSSTYSTYNYTPGGDDIDPEQIFKKYRSTFDHHVANMSESEINAVVGLASVVGGILGSVIGKHIANSAGSSTATNGYRGVAPTGSSVLLGTIGSMAGSFLTSQAAAETIRSIHQQSVDRVTYGQNYVSSSNTNNESSSTSTGNRRNRSTSPQQNSSTNTSTNDNNKDPTISLDDVASAVNAGMRLWHAYKAQK